MELPTLYRKAKTGKVVVWQVWTVGPYIKTKYGQLNGKMQTSSKKVRAKNIGRANERNADKQAESEAKSMWDKRRELRYKEKINDTEEVNYLPMLAQGFKTERLVDGEVFYVQPKLNGVRCIAYWENGKVSLLSRGGKFYNVKHISDAVKPLVKRGYILDGEIFKLGWSLQTITSKVKRPQKDSGELEYWVYDMPDWKGKITWLHRLELINLLRADGLDYKVEYPIKVTPTYTCLQERDLKIVHDKFVKQGHEGAIVRLLEGTYEWGQRSDSLLKYKKFQDDEFKVINCVQGNGRFEGVAIFVCQTKKGRQFRCVCRGTMEARKKQWKDKKNYIGKKLTVRYADLTDDGVPQFPVGIAFRDIKDL